MKERPILFSGAMVRAILDGRKTQTRRVIKPWPMRLIDDIPAMLLECPYGVPGDRLWVRETHCWLDQHIDSVTREDPVVVGYTSDGQIWRFSPHGHRIPDNDLKDYGNFKLRSSRFMPRWASRITLEIVSIRVQRVQEISDFDSFKEGVDAVEADTEDGHCMSFKAGFRRVWDLINIKRGFGWNVNPWVWVVEFKRITP